MESLGNADLSWSSGSVSLTLGEGRDQLNLGFSVGDSLRFSKNSVTITDFDAGNGGDIINLSDFLQGCFNLSSGMPEGNPFQSGHFRLVQDGADAVVRLDFDGYGPGHSETYVRDFLRLSNVDISDLTAWNFAGYDPEGGAPQIYVRVGTLGADTLLSGAFGGLSEGLAGDDTLLGAAGNDELAGDEGDDIIDGGRGNDRLSGGSGDDRISDSSGNDRIDGGAGNDVIELLRPTQPEAPSILETVMIMGGDGNDRLRYDIGDYWKGDRAAVLAVDMGAGNDSVFLSHWKVQTTLTLGSGEDRIEVGEQWLRDFDSLLGSSGIIVTDFEAGSAGDILSPDNFLSGTSWKAGTNPFEAGYLRLVQDGADTIVQVDYFADGRNPYDVVRLEGVTAKSLTAHNFGGYSPDSPTIEAIVRTGTAGDDDFSGTVGDDGLQGFGGDDILFGGAGNDRIEGGEGADHLNGGLGDDQLLGGTGNDRIEDLDGGNDILDGGAGDDVIVLERRWAPGAGEVVINGGDGSDFVTVTPWIDDALTVDLGAGDDILQIKYAPSGGMVISTGSGHDLVALHADLASTRVGPIVIEDFQTGDDGDQLDWVWVAQRIIGHRVWEGDYNPFASGDFVLVQQGNDVVLKASVIAAFDSLVLFKNVRLEDFTDFNLLTDIDARPPVPEADTQTGTSGADAIDGTDGRDVISGLAGDDVIRGLGGNDWLKGGEGTDRLYGGDGDDLLEGGAGAARDRLDGGAGDDTIVDTRGFAAVIGGDGKDEIRISAASATGTMPAIHDGNVDAGAGDDRVHLLSVAYDGYRVALGSGADELLVGALDHSVRATLGEGQDRVILSDGPFVNASQLVISDFAAGPAGDSIDVDSWLGHSLNGIMPHNYWQPGDNPFEMGFLELRQNGTSVELVIWPTAQHLKGFRGSVIFENSRMEDFTADNFNGYDPHATPNIATVVDQQDFVVASGEELIGLNTTPIGNNRALISFIGNGTFLNEGTVVAQQTAPGRLMGISVIYGDTTGFDALFHNAATGRFIVQSDWQDEVFTISSGDTCGFYAGQASTSIRNDGYFEVSARSGTVHGWVTGFDYPRNVINTGELVVRSPWDAYAIQLGLHASFQNDGKITVDAGEIAIGVHYVDYNGAQFVNHGEITVTSSPESPYYSFGIYMIQSYVPRDGEYHYINGGTITADVAIYLYENNRTLPTAGFADVIMNSGTINGAVFVDLGDDRIVNSGAMHGETFLGEGNDIYDGSSGLLDGTVWGEQGNDILIGGAHADIFSGGDGGDRLDGREGADILLGDAGDDRLAPGSGNNIVDGGEGFDTLALTGAKASYGFLAAGDALFLVGEEGATRLSGTEQVAFADGTVATGDLAASLPGFDGLRYVAGYSDLVTGIGSDAAAAAAHYAAYGFAEGRDAKAFDPLDYIAAYGDLRAAFGIDGAAATRHYLAFGLAEGRSDDLFDGLQYAASYTDLSAVFGTDGEAAARHYIRFGAGEGRAADLFDGLRYVASNPDLIVALGDDDDAAATHYIQFGRGEGRDLDGFDALAYGAANADLHAAFGDNVDALTRHYIDFGFYEHRDLGVPAVEMVGMV
ncbi:calcium-binding protein [Sphingobium ummariense]